MLFRSWVLWGLAHLAFMPDNENRISLLLKWLWSIALGERDSLLITGKPDQHIGVEVGLENVEVSQGDGQTPAHPAAGGSTDPAPAKAA